MRRRLRVKPSKGQSLVGFLAGLLFCIIGLVKVIPTFGTFGYVWTLFALIATIMSAINAFTDKGLASHDITIDDDSRQDMPICSKHPEERMKELQHLYDKGLITQDEYQRKRKQIVDDI